MSRQLEKLRDDVVDGLHYPGSIWGGERDGKLHPTCQSAYLRFEQMSQRHLPLSDMACMPCRRQARNDGHDWSDRVAVYFELKG